ncbi:MAG: putative choline transporter, neither null mutation nor overexpression affects choline transport [Chrysothrix sp. TS-e1954]|nr:MAG: putative choline transporter, neither null mutation nor overexpression affects choline transport [Chrysothrix sp. TS-e1954]
MAGRGEAADYYNSGPQQPMPQQPMQAYKGEQAPPQNQQPMYNQPPPNYGQNYGPMQDFGGADGKGTFNQAFKLDKPKWNDLWAGILFLIVFAGFVAVSGLSLQGYSAFKGFNGDGIYNNTNAFGLNTNTVIMFAFIVGVALVLSIGYVALVRVFTKQLIWITGILNIVFAFVTAIYMLTRHYWSGGIVFLIFAIFAVFCFISWIPRIPFSVVMLQTSVDVSKRFGHVYLVSMIGGILAAAFGIWYSITLVAIYAKYEPGNAGAGANPACSSSGSCSTGKVIGLLVFITFAMYWISEWLKNTIHTTISGVYGSWYFCPNNFPKGATRGAFKRAMTYSFGSISFGSLVVAIINMLRQACSIAQNQASQDGNMIGACLFCLIGCFIGLLDWAVQFINRYAFSHIALYGDSYLQAAKDTWTLIKRRGIDALVNECLIGPVFTMGASFIAYVCALLAYLYLIFTSPSYNSDGSFTPVVVAFAFLVGLQIAHIFVTPLSSGVETLFVAMAWDPDVLQREHPELYGNMVRVYPQVQNALRK